jgi:hypothetical protein
MYKQQGDSLVARAVLKVERQIPNSPARDLNLIACALPTDSIFLREGGTVSTRARL